MELTIDQALQKAIEAHKAGQIQEADRLYTAILKAQPKHPDANHNLGVLAVGVGKANEALPFLKTALEANPGIAQFWLSYIDVLVKLDRIADAKSVLDQAKSKGAKGDSFDKLEEQLSDASVVRGPTQDQVQAIINFYSQGQLEQALSQANTLIKQFPHSAILLNIRGAVLKGSGQLDLSVDAYKKALAIKPDYAEAHNNMGTSLKEQGKLEEAIEAYTKALAIKPDYADAYYNMGNTLQEQGKLEEAIEAYKKVLAIKPDYAEAHNNMGNALQEQRKLDEAIEAYTKALAIKPDYTEAYYNMGNALQEQGKLDDAIEAYKKALAIKPDNAEAHNNMGNALREQGKLEEAIEAYTKALDVTPDNTEAYNNMGISLKEQGKLEEAIEAYTKALAIKPDNADAIENCESLLVQLWPLKGIMGYDVNSSEVQTNPEVVLRPKYQIQNAIKAFLEGNFVKANSHCDNYKACGQHFLDTLLPKDKVFCNAYCGFIGKLLDANWDEKHSSENTVYHLGESHSLSYAHRNIIIGGSAYRIAPRITFGAKAFHLYRPKYDAFKAITEAHFASLPKGSKVFLSYGEIDCRPNEGFISAAKKRNKPLEELIYQTTKGYVKWFSDLNADQKHKLYFFNVPAPVYNNKHSADLNSTVARTVALFNTALENYSLHHGFDVVDVFKFSVGKEGFSNGLFHVDRHHLGVKALPEIERQLS